MMALFGDLPVGALFNGRRCCDCVMRKCGDYQMIGRDKDRPAMRIEVVHTCLKHGRIEGFDLPGGWSQYWGLDWEVSYDPLASELEDRFA